MPHPFCGVGHDDRNSFERDSAVLRLAICDVPDHPVSGVDRLLEDAVGSRLDLSVADHLARFADVRRRRARLLARALLILESATLPGAGKDAVTALRRDGRGRPILAGRTSWAVSFSCSASGAACALGLWPTGFAPALGTDMEDLSSAAPASRAFDVRERAAVRALGPHEALRRWTLKEAALKAWGVGLGRDPALTPTGRTGARRGVIAASAEGDPALFWRLIPLPGRWCALAASTPFSLRTRLLRSADVLRAMRSAIRA